MAAPGFLDSISPWSSRSTTPKPPQSKGGDSNSELNPLNLQNKDHVISRLQRLSSQDYPLDCPKATIKWFYAVDVVIPYPHNASSLR